MLRPSYTDLLDVINKEGEDNSVTGSRYSIVIAAAKRARQIVANSEPMVEFNKDNKPVSIAVNEIFEGKLSIVEDGDIVCGEEYCEVLANAEEIAEAEEETAEYTEE